MVTYPLLTIASQAPENAIPPERLLCIPNFVGWRGIVEPRTDGPFARRAIFLSDAYEWRLGQDDYTGIILVPLLPCK